MPCECCDDYNLIQLYQESSEWCFTFSHTSTFELIPSVASATGSLGNNWRRIQLFRHLEMFTDRDSKDDKESLTQWTLRLEERKMVTLPNDEHWQCNTQGITFGRKKLQNTWFRRFDERIHDVQQLETAATSALAHVQQFAVASTFIGWADVQWYVMREDTVVEQATAREIIHEDVEMLRRFGAASLTVVFELPLSDVAVVDGERAVLDCRDQCPTWRDPAWRSPGSPRRRTVERRSWPTSSATVGNLERLPIPRLRRKCRDLPDRRLSDRFSRPTADSHGDNQDSTSPVVRSLFDMPAVTFNTSAWTSRTLTLGQCVNSAECVYLYY